MNAVDILRLVLLLLAAAIVLALAARRLHIPPSAAYVVGGMTLAVVPGLPQLNVDPDLILPLFLPPLLLSSAFFTVWRDFRANLRPILLLAIGAVAFTTLVVGVVLKLLVPGLPWAACFTLGAIISPPDAVAASSVLDRLKIPRRLRTIIEGESLVNDASGLVLYRYAAAAAMTGGFSVAPALASFVYIALAGVAIGLAFSWSFMWLGRRVRDPRLSITASFLVAWASYMVAEAAEASGVLATVACGLTMGWYQHAVFTSQTRVEARTTWRFAVFVLEALVFVLIGLSLNGVLARLGPVEAMRLAPLGLLITAAVTLARFAWLFPAAYGQRALPWVRAQEERPPAAALLVIGWSGMRGVVSLAVALALPENFPGRDLILFVTFAVILLTVFVQGTTLGLVIRWLGVATHSTDDEAPSPETLARAEVELAALRLIEERTTDEMIGPFARDLLPEFRERSGQAARFSGSGGALLAERNARRTLRLEALAAARTRLLAMHRTGDIHDEILHAVERDLDLDELRLRGVLEG